MNIMLIDGDKQLLEEIAQVVQSVKPEANIYIVNSCQEIFNVAEKYNPDVIFCDIDFPGMCGFKVTKQLKTIYPNLNSIFISAYSEAAIDAFHVHASGFLLKPVDREAVEKALIHLRNPIAC